MIKTPKSELEIEAEEEINHMEIMVLNQRVRIADAKQLITKTYKILGKCEELRKSRDKWRDRAETAESKTE